MENLLPNILQMYRIIEKKHNVSAVSFAKELQDKVNIKNKKLIVELAKYCSCIDRPPSEENFQAVISPYLRLVEGLLEEESLKISSHDIHAFLQSLIHSVLLLGISESNFSKEFFVDLTHKFADFATPGSILIIFAQETALEWVKPYLYERILEKRNDLNMFVYSTKSAPGNYVLLDKGLLSLIYSDTLSILSTKESIIFNTIISQTESIKKSEPIYHHMYNKIRFSTFYALIPFIDMLLEKPHRAYITFYRSDALESFRGELVGVYEDYGRTDFIVYSEDFGLVEHISDFRYEKDLGILIEGEINFLK